MATHHGICNFCDSICGLEIDVVDGEVRSIRGDKLDPFSLGHMCAKGLAQKHLRWGHDRVGARMSVAAKHAGVSMNDIVDENLVDPVTGTAVLDGIPVAVSSG